MRGVWQVGTRTGRVAGHTFGERFGDAGVVRLELDRELVELTGQAAAVPLRELEQRACRFCFGVRGGLEVLVLLQNRVLYCTNSSKSI